MRPANASPVRVWGRVASVSASHVEIVGLANLARVGDVLSIGKPRLGVEAEVLNVCADKVLATLFSDPSSVQIGDRADLLGPQHIAPNDGWLGYVLDGNGRAGEGSANTLPNPCQSRALASPPPAVATRRLLGPRLSTGFMVFDALLPIRQGQRLGIFAGSGVGKSTLLGNLAGGIDTDRVVIGLIGERSREVMEFSQEILTPTVREKTVIFAATANEAPGMKKRAAYAAMATAEHFRDEGQRVLLIIDSLTRFAEAHRETALLAGEAPALNAFPTSTVRVLSELVERAGTGAPGQGDITALFSVLVAGSDFEEPVADMVRGILDGHIVMSREIAERGRFPAIDVGRSVSRALPAAATDRENQLICQYRQFLTKYESLKLLLNANMYHFGRDKEGDRAIALHSALDNFVSERNSGSIDEAYQRLEGLLASSEPELAKTGEEEILTGPGTQTR